MSFLAIPNTIGNAVSNVPSILGEAAQTPLGRKTLTKINTMGRPLAVFLATQTVCGLINKVLKDSTRFSAETKDKLETCLSICALVGSGAALRQYSKSRGQPSSLKTTVVEPAITITTATVSIAVLFLAIDIIGKQLE